MSTDSDSQVSPGVSPGSSDTSDSDWEGSSDGAGTITTMLPSFVHLQNVMHVNSDLSVQEDEPEPVPIGGAGGDVGPPVWMDLHDDPGPSRPCPSLQRKRDRIQLQEGGMISGIATELDAFQAFLTPTVFAALLEFTSERLLAKGKPPLTMPELHIWFALCFSMGITRLPSTRHHWTSGATGKSVLCHTALVLMFLCVVQPWATLHLEVLCVESDGTTSGPAWL